MMVDARVCQFCGRLDDARALVYYAMRHYAHGRCLVEELTVGRILRLKTHALEQLPFLALQEFNMLELVENELAKRRQAA